MGFLLCPFFESSFYDITLKWFKISPETELKPDFVSLQLLCLLNPDTNSGWLSETGRRGANPMPVLVLLDAEVSRINFDGLLCHAGPGRHFWLFQLMLYGNNSVIFGALDEKTKTKTNQPKQTDKTPKQIKPQNKIPNPNKIFKRYFLLLERKRTENILFQSRKSSGMVSPRQTKNCPATNSDEFLLTLKGSATFPRHWKLQLTSEKPRMECSREKWSLRKRSKIRQFTKQDESTSYTHCLKLHLWNFTLISCWCTHLTLPKTVWFPTAFDQNWQNYNWVLEPLGSFWY